MPIQHAVGVLGGFLGFMGWVAQFEVGEEVGQFETVFGGPFRPLVHVWNFVEKVLARRYRVDHARHDCPALAWNVVGGRCPDPGGLRYRARGAGRTQGREPSHDKRQSKTPPLRPSRCAAPRPLRPTGA